MSDALRQSFDAIAEEYAHRFADELGRKPFDRDLLSRFATQLPSRAAVLDIGTGAAGHIGRFFADQGFAVTGVDLSTGSVEVARRLNPEMRFVAADYRSLPQSDVSVDAVVGFYCFIYGSDEDIIRGLSEARRVLRTGGRLLVAVHGALDDRPTQESFSEFEGTPVDIMVRYTSPATLATLSERAGLRIDELIVRDPYVDEHQSRRLYLLASRP